MVANSVGFIDRIYYYYYYILLHYGPFSHLWRLIDQFSLIFGYFVLITYLYIISYYTPPQKKKIFNYKHQLNVYIGLYGK